ncbi:MAG TPA: pentapeptide repeat-containing protein [Actinocrinis sp.]|nr:pentapeptide repeat-containing protein [Actinocrinis sp.]
MKRYPRLAAVPFATVLAPYPHEGGVVELGPGADFECAHFEAVRFPQPRAAGAHFSECAFSDTTFDGGRLRGARFHDAWLGAVRLVGVDLAECSFVDATIDGSVLAGVPAFGSLLRRVVFQRCKLDSVNFRTAKLADVIFEDCTIKDVDFAGASLQRVSFSGCTLTDVDFTKASLSKVDLRGAELISLSGLDALRGATIDTGQLLGLAPALAAFLGINVQDARTR